MKTLPLLLLLLALSLGCASAPYVAADKATYEAIAPEYSNYVRTDSTLSDAQKKIREDTLSTWKRRIEAGEKEVAQ